ncbi:unnamed protein product, partial [Didymodactylos carnosus]
CVSKGEGELSLLLSQSKIPMDKLNYIKNTFVLIKESNRLLLNIKQQFSAEDDGYQQINDCLQRFIIYVNNQNYCYSKQKLNYITHELYRIKRYIHLLSLMDEAEIKQIQLGNSSAASTLTNELKILTLKYRPFIIKNCRKI